MKLHALTDVVSYLVGYASAAKIPAVLVLSLTRHPEAKPKDLDR